MPAKKKPAPGSSKSPGQPSARLGLSPAPAHKEAIASIQRPVAIDISVPPGGGLVRPRQARKKLTGRLLLRVDAGAGLTAIEKQAGANGLRLTGIRDFSTGKDGDILTSAFREADGVILETLKIVILNGEQADRMRSWQSLRNSYVTGVEHDRYLYASHARSTRGIVKGPFKNTPLATWGIQAIHAGAAGLTGRGVKVAILDTGLDGTHPDWAGRTIHRKSFIGNRQAIDREGHGTLCAGIAGGHRKRGTGARYGVASEAQLYIGKILDDAGEGSDGLALAGIDWALGKGCRAISLSLGAEVESRSSFSDIFEEVAQTALRNNSLLIAAAGNESDREEEQIAPVNHPANCPSIMAVGALTESLAVAAYSNAGAAGSSGQVDIAAPGDNIVSCRIGGGYRSESGTSMATPFIAGVAALLWGQYPSATAAEIWMKLTQQARRLVLPASDTGAGLVYVP